ncbi:MAG: hypothetical protein M1829_001603 [Trizodia sp. TS-e1964]|nr:MAG: hypothetical protein M1829_001603 [Trizodia sp. TS-e1964]
MAAPHTPGPTTPSPPPLSISIGVLALQGGFSEHVQLLRRASTLLPSVSCHITEVRTAAALASCDALVIPGGESSAIALLAADGVAAAVRAFVRDDKKPTWGTCAGLVLLARQVEVAGERGEGALAALDVCVVRNAWGRQVQSFVRGVKLPFLGGGAAEFRGVFVRAPLVKEIVGLGEGEQRPAVEVLARLPPAEGEEGEGAIVAVRQGNVFATSFHPEYTPDTRVHVWWLRRLVQDVTERRRRGGDNI